MSTTVRNIIGIVFVIGLSVVIGCSTTQAPSGSKQTNIFSFPKSKQKKEEERATPKSMEEVLGLPRVNSIAR